MRLSILASDHVIIVTMCTFLLRIVYIIIVISVPCSLCEKCGSSMDDEKLRHYNNSVMIPLESYCFVNECTIRIEESNVLLSIINNTGDWVIATNTTNLFMVFVNDNITNCSSDTDHGTNLYQLDMKLYVIRMIISSCGTIAGVANIVMHLMFKELRTVSGILIIFQCASISYVLMMSTLRTPLFYHQINTPAEVCAVFFDYLCVVCINVYVVTRTTILAHFSNVMYRSYRLLRKNENKRSLLLKYITFIVVVSAIASILIIVVDIKLDNNFRTEDGQCAYFFDTSVREGKKLTKANVIHFVNLIIWLLIQIVLATIGLALYFLVTKKCCAASSSRVFIIVMTVIDLNATIYIVCGLVIHVSTLIAYSIIVTISAIQQVALFILFASSSKVTCCSTNSI